MPVDHTFDFAELEAEAFDPLYDAGNPFDAYETGDYTIRSSIDFD